jgi:beta-phosphoglucomutase-like phosphatase (HAD superfamily)
MGVGRFDLNEPYAGLIFDCDGTLVDTAPIHYLAVSEAMRSLGHEITGEWYFARTGLTPAALFREFEEQNGVTIDTRELSRRYRPIFLSNLDQAKEVTAVAEVARANFGKVPMAVASNGHLDNVKATLRAAGLLKLFDSIVSADDVAHGKPEPDVYVEAARRIKIAPQDCIVFEDTDEGLAAAQRAGMRTRDIRLVDWG